MQNPVKKFCSAILLAVVLVPGVASAKEYLLTGLKPNQLVLIDAKERKVERTYDIPNGGQG
ncbi:MAG: hypothetical protein OES09_14820, partial [Gammaproteobacteria bacterium]|nr:hypothetical protein [Gammaproteobacteria bacterium]